MVIKHGNITLDAMTSLVLWKGVPQQHREFRVIYRLVMHHGNCLSYRALYDVLKNKPGFIAGG